MRRVSLREANQNFSACIAEVEGGEHIVLERRGVPVAEIVPFRKTRRNRQGDREWDEMLRLLERGIPLGGGKAPSKDEMHER